MARTTKSVPSNARAVWLGLAVVLVLVGGGLEVGCASPLAAHASSAVEVADSGGGTVSFGSGEIESLVPSRLLDTRIGNGGPAGKVGPGSATVLQVAGRGGVPAVGAGAVVLNVVATEPTANGYITVYPTGVERPLASNLNTVVGESVPGLVVVKLGAGGTVALFNSAGETHLIADVAGWFPEIAGLQPMTPVRLLDTRDGSGAPVGAVGEGSTTNVQVTGRAGIPSVGVGAVVLNVTVTDPTSNGFVTVFPAGEERPLASNLNFTPGLTVPNLVIAKVGAGGAVSLFNSGGHTHLVADVAGWFPTTSSLHATSPTRLLDTRQGVGAPRGPVGPESVTALQVTGRNGLPDTGVGAVIVNVTVTEPTAFGYITVYPAGVDRPTASNLNMRPGQTVPNLVIAKVGAGGVINLFNSAGTSHLVADVVGWFPDSGTNLTTLSMKAGTILAGAGDVISFSGTSATGGTVVLSGSADVPPLGGYIAVAPHAAVPQGLFGTVTAVVRNLDGSSTVTYLPARLEDGFVDINSSFHGAVPLHSGVPTESLKRTESDVECQTAGGVSIKPTLAFDAGEILFEFDLSDRFILLKLPMTVTAGISAEFSGSLSCTVELPSITIPMLSATVDATPQFTLSVSASLSVTASLTESVNFGFVAHGSSVQNLSSTSRTMSGDLTAAASASVTFRPSLRVALKEFGVAGGYVDLGIDLTGTIDPFNLPCASLTAQVTLDFGFDVGRFGFDWTIQLASIQTGKLTIFEERDNCRYGPWLGTITYSGQTGGVGNDPPYGSQDKSSGAMTFTLSGEVDDFGRALATASGTTSYTIWTPALQIFGGYCARRERTGTATFTNTPGVLISFLGSTPMYVYTELPDTAPMHFVLSGEQYPPPPGDGCVPAVETANDFATWTSQQITGCPTLPLPVAYDQYTTLLVITGTDTYSGNPFTAGNGWCSIGQNDPTAATYSLTVTYNLHRVRTGP